MFNSKVKKETESKIQGFQILGDWGRGDVYKAVTPNDYVIVVKDCTRKDVLRLAGANTDILRDLKTLDDRKSIPLGDERITGETNFSISVSAYIGKKDVPKLQEAENEAKAAAAAAKKREEDTLLPIARNLLKLGKASTLEEARKLVGLD